MTALRRFTLPTDGRADSALIPPVTWLLHEKLPRVTTQIEWAELAKLRRPPTGLDGRIRAAIENYPCDVLLVHRDAETEPREKRVAEIQAAVRDAGLSQPHVCVVTVRMQEAWMLIDERAIRNAAGNPNGNVPLHLPKPSKIEDLPDPKITLHEILKTASELTGRRVKKFKAPAAAHRVAELIDDWTPLRKLSAFREFEKELDEILAQLK